MPNPRRAVLRCVQSNLRNCWLSVSPSVGRETLGWGDPHTLGEQKGARASMNAHGVASKASLANTGEFNPCRIKREL